MVNFFIFFFVFGDIIEWFKLVGLIIVEFNCCGFLILIKPGVLYTKLSVPLRLLLGELKDELIYYKCCCLARNWSIVKFGWGHVKTFLWLWGRILSNFFDWLYSEAALSSLSNLTLWFEFFSIWSDLVEWYVFISLVFILINGCLLVSSFDKFKGMLTLT